MRRLALSLLLLSSATATLAQDTEVPGLPLVVPAEKAAPPAPPVTAPSMEPAPRSINVPPQGPTAAELAALQQMVGNARNTVAVDVTPPPAEMTVEPGKNEVIPIARTHLNRLVTPFSAPVIKTTSDATTNTDGNIIYIATQSTAPVTMYVMQEGAPEEALSLTLLPRDIPPVQVRLYLAGQEKAPVRPPQQQVAVEWETEQPYVETIKTLFRALALGQVPDGYGLDAIRGHHPLMPYCQIPGVDVRPGQILEGGSIITFVARAVNATIDPVEIDESGCAARGVLAVAAWPHTLVEPGGETELYIAVRRPDPTAEPNPRPSMLRHQER